MATPMLLAVIGSVALATVVTRHTAGAAESLYEPDQLVARLSDVAKRDLECALTGGKCFNTGQCCDGLVCAVLNEAVGQNPELPGNCVKSKDLQTCGVGGQSDDCPIGHRCLNIGRMGQRYCLPTDRELNPSEFRSIKMTDRRRQHGLTGLKTLGKIGSQCSTDADCMPKSDDGQYQMCCQLVSRARQGSKRICDRVTEISTCTN